MRCFVDGRPCKCDMEKLDDCSRDPIRVAEDHQEEYETIARFSKFMDDEDASYRTYA